MMGMQGLELCHSVCDEVKKGGVVSPVCLVLLACD